MIFQKSSLFLVFEDQLFQYVNTFVESTMQINGPPPLFYILYKWKSCHCTTDAAVPFLFNGGGEVIDINADVP